MTTRVRGEPSRSTADRRARDDDDVLRRRALERELAEKRARERDGTPGRRAGERARARGGDDDARENAALVAARRRARARETRVRDESGGEGGRRRGLVARDDGR